MRPEKIERLNALKNAEFEPAPEFIAPSIIEIADGLEQEDPARFAELKALNAREIERVQKLNLERAPAIQANNAARREYDDLKNEAFKLATVKNVKEDDNGNISKIVLETPAGLIEQNFKFQTDGTRAVLVDFSENWL